MEYKPEKFVSLIYSLISDVADNRIVKYKRKMVNAYVNHTFQLVHSKETHIHTKFLLTICMVSIILRIEEEVPPIKDNAFQKIKVDLIDSLCKKEISRIRAIILDLYTGTYTEDTLHGVRPEPWAVKIVQDMSQLVPETKVELFKQANRIVMTTMHKYLQQEIKEAFISKTRQFGKKGNQLLINILYIDKYFKEYASTLSMNPLIEEAKKNFKDKKMAEDTNSLLKYIETSK